jgi:hypothetical protein
VTAREGPAVKLRRGAILLLTWVVVTPILVGTVTWALSTVIHAPTNHLPSLIFGMSLGVIGVAISAALGWLGIKWAYQK